MLFNLLSLQGDTPALGAPEEEEGQGHGDLPLAVGEEGQEGATASPTSTTSGAGSSGYCSLNTHQMDALCSGFQQLNVVEHLSPPSTDPLVGGHTIEDLDTGEILTYSGPLVQDLYDDLDDVMAGIYDE